MSKMYPTKLKEDCKDTKSGEKEGMSLKLWATVEDRRG